MASAAPAVTQAGRTYEQYRNDLIVRGVTLPAIVVFLVTALYATSEAFYAPQRFWPERWAYLAETLTPLVACWLCRGRLHQHAQLVLLGADLTYSVGVLVQALQPTTTITGAALAIAIKVMATAVFFPWQPRLQYISASVTIVGYWTVLYLGGRIGGADSALFQTLGPCIAAVLSAAGAAGIDRNRRAMFEARAWLQVATESAKVAIWSSDLRTLTVHFSSGWKRLLGRDESEITLAALWDLVHPDDRDKSTSALQEHLQRRTDSYETEQRMLHAGGSYRWVLSRGLVAYDAEGRPSGLLGADIDITEDKQLQEALRRSEEKYRQLVEDIGETIYAVDATGTLTYVSPIAESLYGYAPAEVINRSFTDFVPAQDIPGLTQGFAATMSGTPDLRDHRIVTKAGDIRWVRNSARAVTEGRGIGLRGVLTDVTDRRRIEQELHALTKDLDARVIERTRQLSEALDQRRQAEQALRQQSHRNKLLLQTASDGIHILNVHGRVVEVNAAFCAMLGYSAEELAHMWVGDWDRQWNEQELRARLSSLQGQPVVFESKHCRKDGTTIDVEISATAVDIDGETLLYASARDITQRKRAQAASAALLQITTQIAGTLDAAALLDDVQRRVAGVLPCDAVVTLLLDPAGEVLRVASHHGIQPDWRATVSGLEFRREGRFGEGVASGQPLVINDFANPGVLAELAGQVPIGALAAVTLRVRGRFFGRLCAARMRGGAPFTAPDIELLSGIAQQVAIGLETSQLHEAQRAEATVSGALARLGHELIANLNAPHLLDRLCQLTTEMLHCDVSSTFFRDPEKRDWSGAATFGNTPEFWESLHAVKISEAMFAREIEQLTREGILQFQPTDFAKALAPATLLVLQSGVELVVYIALWRGEQLVGAQTAAWYHHTGRLDSDEERIARGIGQMASIALEHVRIVEELERANRLKSDFMATMSHELRTPLNIIMGYNALLLDETFGALHPDQADTVQRTQKRAEELLELIDATLNVSRLETDRSPLHPEEVDVGDLVGALAAEMPDRYDKPTVTMGCDVSPQLPRIHTDVAKLKLVVKNLLSNAMKFTAEGRVTVSACRRDSGVEITVSDTGIGIRPEVLAVIFEPFRQGESGPTSEYGGVGLGLYIVSRLVELLAGTVTVDSEVGRGSAFHVWLPLDVKAPQARHPAPEETVRGAGIYPPIQSLKLK